jgi:hypothetical protein
MAIKPILSNTEMVRAILEGRKSCTRRIVKPQQFIGMLPDKCKNGAPEKFLKEKKLMFKPYCDMTDIELINTAYKAPYQPGDILYVRETWHKYIKRVGEGKSCHLAEFYGYKASIANSEDAEEPWKPSIHMPKEAARIWIKVTNVRVEQLQEITIDGIRNEGLSSMAVHAGDMEIAMEEWKNLWNSTIKKSDLDSYGWNANPWVWVIEFERCEKPEGV